MVCIGVAYITVDDHKKQLRAGTMASPTRKNGCCVVLENIRSFTEPTHSITKPSSFSFLPNTFSLHFLLTHNPYAGEAQEGGEGSGTSVV